ncbi:unnamed protein product [Ectocarpus sp. 12 AP-2014]
MCVYVFWSMPMRRQSSTTGTGDESTNGRIHMQYIHFFKVHVHEIKMTAKTWSKLIAWLEPSGWMEIHLYSIVNVRGFVPLSSCKYPVQNQTGRKEVEVGTSVVSVLRIGRISAPLKFKSVHHRYNNNNLA